MIGKKTSKEKKETKENIEQERNLLKITLDYLVNENESLKRQVDDMRTTVKANKEQLKVYVETITGKDKAVEKMNNTIDQLSSLLKSREDYIKTLHEKLSVRNGTKESAGISSHSNLQKASTNYRASDNDLTYGENFLHNQSEIGNKNHALGSYTMRAVASPLILSKPVKFETLTQQKGRVGYKQNELTKQFFTKQNKIYEELSYIKNELEHFLDDKAPWIEEFECCPETEESRRTVKNLFSDGGIKSDEGDLLGNLLLSPENGQMLFLVDSKKGVWELLKRDDLDETALTRSENIKSLTDYVSLVPEREEIGATIEFDDDSNKNLQLDHSGTEMDVSNLVRETLDKISDL